MKDKSNESGGRPLSLLRGESARRRNEFLALSSDQRAALAAAFTDARKLRMSDRAKAPAADAPEPPRSRG